MKTMSKKANMNFLYAFVIGFITVGIVMVFVADMNADLQADQTANSAAYNVSADVAEGISGLSSKLPLIATVIGFVLILGYFAYIKR